MARGKLRQRRCLYRMICSACVFFKVKKKKIKNTFTHVRGNIQGVQNQLLRQFPRKMEKKIKLLYITTPINILKLTFHQHVKLKWNFTLFIDVLFNIDFGRCTTIFKSKFFSLDQFKNF